MIAIKQKHMKAGIMELINLHTGHTGIIGLMAAVVKNAKKPIKIK